MTVTKEEKQSLNRTAWILGLVLSIGGLSLALAANGFQGDPNVSISMFFVGIIFAGFGLLIVTKGAQLGEDYTKLKRQAETLAEDEGGIVWVWVVALCTWAIMAVAYFSLSVVVYMVLDSVEAFYPWGAQELGVISLTRNVCAWFLIIMTIGLLGWALINSARKVEDTWGY